MRIFRKIYLLQKCIRQLKRGSKTIGLVPTMGALHEGHLSLIRQARKENEILAVSIFVNPKQFGPKEDYLRYPRPLDKDKKLCLKEKVDILFIPAVEEMYPPVPRNRQGSEEEGYLTYVQVEKMSEKLCGKFRPGHFRGVATVVTKLFNIIQPDRAYFGEKDFQQLQIIKKMAEDLNLPVKIIPCPIVREKPAHRSFSEGGGGLALSSRNTYLTADERNQALSLYQALKKAENLIIRQKVKKSQKVIEEMKKIILPARLRQRGEPARPVKIDYLEICDPETLEPLSQVRLPLVIALAVWFGKTRLIDNLHLK